MKIVLIILYLYLKVVIKYLVALGLGFALVLLVLGKLAAFYCLLIAGLMEWLGLSRLSSFCFV